MLKVTYTTVYGTHLIEYLSGNREFHNRTASTTAGAISNSKSTKKMTKKAARTFVAVSSVEFSSHVHSLSV